MKKLIAVIASCCFAFVLAGCAQQSQSDSGPDYADDEVMGALADGLEKRFDTADKHEQEADGQTKDDFSESTQVEIEAIAPFRDRQFEDPELQEAVVSYANLLDDMLQLTEEYPVDSEEFIEGWTSLYDERSVSLKQFADDYGLAVDAAHEETFEELLRNANAVEEQTETEDAINGLVSSLVFEKNGDGYGSFTYSAIGENTSDISFGNVDITLSLYDAEGVKVEEAHAYTSAWPVGEKVRFEAFGSIDAAEIKVAVSYYDIVE